MLNVDLSKTIACDRQAVFKSAEFCGQFINLTFLSLHFTPQIELNERLEGTESSQKFIQVIFHFCFAINGILLPKLFCPIVRKKCSSDQEKLLKFEAEIFEFTRTIYLNSERSVQF